MLHDHCRVIAAEAAQSVIVHQVHRISQREKVKRKQKKEMQKYKKHRIGSTLVAPYGFLTSLEQRPLIITKPRSPKGPVGCDEP